MDNKPEKVDSPHPITIFKPVPSQYEIIYEGPTIIKRCTNNGLQSDPRLLAEMSFLQDNMERSFLPNVIGTDGENCLVMERVFTNKPRKDILGLLGAIDIVQSISNPESLPKWYPVKHIDDHITALTLLTDAGYLSQQDFYTLSLLLENIQDIENPFTTVHGDLRPRHVLIQPDGGLKIIDWEDACLGPALIDYANLIVQFPLNASVIRDHALNNPTVASTNRSPTEVGRSLDLFELSRRICLLYYRSQHPPSARGVLVAKYHSWRIKVLLDRLSSK